jgi:photosystem II stability/assembly factor-like uncharacterized protein
MKIALLLLAVVTAGISWSVKTSGTDTNLRGISVVGGSKTGQDTIIWATGSHGVILRSLDSGKTWERLSIPETASLDFRGVQAFSADEAYVMSSGPGDKSRIYRTSDGGKNWKMQFSDDRHEFFLDGLACVSSTNCFALSDPVAGKFLVLHTEDGKNWRELPGDKMPDALPAEGAFAASNSSLLVTVKREIFFGTGGPAARVFHSDDNGKSWTVVETPIMRGTAPQGIFSLARNGDIIVAVGGDYERPDRNERSAAYSIDHGKTWKLSRSFPGGYRSAVVKSQSEFIAVGPTGADVSRTGVDWRPLESIPLNSVAFEDGKGWGIGTRGTIAECVKKRM